MKWLVLGTRFFAALFTRILLVIFCFFWPNTEILADDTRLEKFYKRARTTRYATFGGQYHSDQNSKDYKLMTSFKQKSANTIYAAEFLHKVNYEQRSTATTPVKVQELYDLELSSKRRIADSDYYFNFYHRTKYDEYEQYNKYYYDIVTAGGLGRTYLNSAVEFDVNIGPNEVKNFHSHLVVNPNLQANIRLTDRLSLISRGSIFYKRFESTGARFTYNQEFRNRLSFRISRTLAIEFYHSYEQNRYISDSKKDRSVNNTNRTALLRLKYVF